MTFGDQNGTTVASTADRVLTVDGCGTVIPLIQASFPGYSLHILHG